MVIKHINRTQRGIPPHHFLKWSVSQLKAEHVMCAFYSSTDISIHPWVAWSTPRWGGQSLGVARVSTRPLGSVVWDPTEADACWHLWIYEMHIMAATGLHLSGSNIRALGVVGDASLFYDKDDLFNKTSLLKGPKGWCSMLEYAVDLLVGHLIGCHLICWLSSLLSTPNQKHRCLVALDLKLLLLAFVSTSVHNETHLSGRSSVSAYVLMLHILQLAFAPKYPSVPAVWHLLSFPY